MQTLRRERATGQGTEDEQEKKEEREQGKHGEIAPNDDDEVNKQRQHIRPQQASPRAAGSGSTE